MDWLKNFWSAWDVPKFLACTIVLVWLYMLLTSATPDEVLKNVIMILIGFYFGSSTGSKAKDAALGAPPAAPVAPKE